VAITSSLPVSTILRTVWDDLGELSVRLRSQSIIACASAVFFALIGGIPAITDNRMLAEVFDLMGTIVLVPFEIAIYRLLISGEAASGYRFDISTGRIQRMLGWTAGFWFLGNIRFICPALSHHPMARKSSSASACLRWSSLPCCDWRFSWPPSR
jgi:hypothetical protein